MALELQPLIDFAKPVIAAVKPFVPPFVGAALGYLLEKEEARGKKVIAFVVGFSLAVYGSGWISAYFKIIDVEIIAGIAFVLGVFGKTLVTAGFEQIPKTIAAVSERVTSFIGGGSK